MKNQKPKTTQIKKKKTLKINYPQPKFTLKQNKKKYQTHLFAEDTTKIRSL